MGALEALGVHDAEGRRVELHPGEVGTQLGVLGEGLKVGGLVLGDRGEALVVAAMAEVETAGV